MRRLKSLENHIIRRRFALSFVVLIFLGLTQSHVISSADAQTVKETVGTKDENKKEKKTVQERLAKAALERTKHLVIYNPKYYKIPYPNGDVPAHFGVCTDVVIRAYRAVGIDLQKDVHEKMGGDKNIAHRRVKVLEKFFKRFGQSLPVSKNPKNYKPGDIVTFYLKEAISSKDHIAIVSDKIGISGNPMIIHNIGLGPKLDDDLFSYQIRGHYRYGS
ncbi:hypothetical protein NBRC116602_22700 [Hyphomicrobiales bacterium 4NK60-0047b]